MGTLQILHGVIMGIAWSLLSSFGIMSSAFRYLYPKGPNWFKAHRGVQIAVVCLTLIGFIIAIAFTAEKGAPHFANGHMIGGLIVTLLAILQPINAYFRPHPPSDGWPNGKKPQGRVVWEYVHKFIGYLTWMLSLIVTAFGFWLIDAEELAYVQIVWIVLLLVVYITLSVMK